MIQIDMPMPESCVECRFSQGGYMYCHAMPENFCGYVNDCEEDGRPEWCPLKAQEPKRGRWIKKPYLLGTSWFCNLCGSNYGMPHEIFNYCPNCGARMEED